MAKNQLMHATLGLGCNHLHKLIFKPINWGFLSPFLPIVWILSRYDADIKQPCPVHLGVLIPCID